MEDAKKSFTTVAGPLIVTFEVLIVLTNGLCLFGIALVVTYCWIKSAARCVGKVTTEDHDCGTDVVSMSFASLNECNAVLKAYTTASTPAGTTLATQEDVATAAAAKEPVHKPTRIDSVGYTAVGLPK